MGSGQDLINGAEVSFCFCRSVGLWLLMEEEETAEEEEGEERGKLPLLQSKPKTATVTWMERE